MNTYVLHDAQTKKNVPFFLDFAIELPEHIQLEVAQSRECIVYDGDGSSKSVDD